MRAVLANSTRTTSTLSAWPTPQCSKRPKTLWPGDWLLWITGTAHRAHSLGRSGVHFAHKASDRGRDRGLASRPARTAADGGEPGLRATGSLLQRSVRRDAASPATRLARAVLAGCQALLLRQRPSWPVGLSRFYWAAASCRARHGGEGERMGFEKLAPNPLCYFSRLPSSSPRAQTRARRLPAAALPPPGFPFLPTTLSRS